MKYCTLKCMYVRTRKREMDEHRLERFIHPQCVPDITAGHSLVFSPPAWSCLIMPARNSCALYQTNGQHIEIWCTEVIRAHNCFYRSLHDLMKQRQLLRLHVYVRAYGMCFHPVHQCADLRDPRWLLGLLCPHSSMRSVSRFWSWRITEPQYSVSLLNNLELIRRTSLFSWDLQHILTSVWVRNNVTIKILIMRTRANVWKKLYKYVVLGKKSVSFEDW